MAKATHAPRAKASRPAQGSAADDKTMNDRKRNLATDGVKPGKGKIVQKKQTIGEALAQGTPNLSAIGSGSIKETAPAVQGSLSTVKSDKVVQQGDEVIIHTRNPWNARLENAGEVIKVNQDGTIAVRVPLDDGRYHDFSPVYNGPRNGEDWFSWPPKGEEHSLDAIEKAE
jgi:hypothetical protein